MIGSKGDPPSDGGFRRGVEQAATGVVAVQDGLIAYANPQAAVMFGRGRIASPLGRVRAILGPTPIAPSEVTAAAGSASSDRPAPP